MALHHSPRIVTNGLVLCLDAGNRKSYSGSGNVWRDLAGYNNGTLKNSPAYNSINKGFYLDGADDYFYVSSILPIVYNFTVNFWIKINTTDNHRGIFCIKNASDSADFTAGNFAIHTIYGGYFGLEALDLNVGGASRNNTVINQILSYCTVVCDQSNLQVRYFLNGVLDGTQTITTNYTFNDHNALFLGCRQYSITGENNYENPINADIYSYQYYNRALTTQEVLQNYNATKGRYKL
jgi:hypothetical protein